VSLSTTQAILATFPLSTDFPETVLRARGSFLFSGTANGAGDAGVAAIGLIVVQEAAATVGGVSVPGPANDINANWLWHQFVPMISNEVTAASDTALGLFARVEMDSKAMRIVKPDQVVVLVIETVTGSGLAQQSVAGGLRILSGLTR